MRCDATGCCVVDGWSRFRPKRLGLNLCSWWRSENRRLAIQEPQRYSCFAMASDVEWDEENEDDDDDNQWLFLADIQRPGWKLGRPGPREIVRWEEIGVSRNGEMRRVTGGTKAYSGAVTLFFSISFCSLWRSTRWVFLRFRECCFSLLSSLFSVVCLFFFFFLHA